MSSYSPQSRILILGAGCFVPYPFQYNLRHLPKPHLPARFNGLLEVARGGRSEAANFRDWIPIPSAAGSLSPFLFPYNCKIGCIGTPVSPPLY